MRVYVYYEDVDTSQWIGFSSMTGSVQGGNVLQVGDGGLTQKNFTTTLKTKLDGVATSANNYTLTAASASALGGVKIGTNLAIDGAGVLSATDTDTDTVYTHPTTNGNKHIPVDGSTGQFLKWDSAGTAVWAADNDTVYTHPTTNGNKHIPQDGSTGQFLKWDSAGTAVWAADNDTVYTHPTTNGNKHIPQDGSTGQFLKWDSAGTAVWAADNDTVYTHPTTNGNKHIPQDGSTGQFLKWDSAGTAVWAADNDTDTVYTHPTGSGNNHIPANGSTGQFLKYDSAGTAVWAADNNTDTVYTHPTTAGNKHVPAGGASGQVLSYASDGTAQWVSAFSAGASYATFVSKTSVSTAVSAVDITNLDADAHYLFRGWFIFATDNNMSFSFYDGASINTAQAIYYQQNKMSGLTTDYSASSSTQSATNKNYDTYIGGHFSRGLTFDGSILTKSGTAKMVLQTQGRTTPDIVSTYTLGQGTAGAGQHFITAGYNATNIAKSIRGLRLKAWSGNISSGELLLFKVNEA
tara:strand:+ start:587 stop:2146 length:1560 start_codon:yes stop_codon:yes gene_type:complete